MKPRGIRYKCHYAKQDPFAIWEARSLSCSMGSMGLISRFIHQKVNRLEKEYHNLGGDHGEKNGRRFKMSDQKELVKALTQIINELPPQEKTLFSLHYCEGLNFKEIGEVLDCSELKAIRLFRDSIKRVAAKMQLRTTN